MEVFDIEELVVPVWFRGPVCCNAMQAGFMRHCVFECGMFECEF